MKIVKIITCVLLVSVLASCAQFKSVFHTTGQSLGTAGKEIGHSVVDNSKQVANNANNSIQGE